MERSRTIHMSSADAEYEFMKKYGAGNLAEQVYRSSRQVARQSAMIERFGTSPKEELARQMRGLSDAEKDMVMRHWANVDGSAQIPGQSIASPGRSGCAHGGRHVEAWHGPALHLNNVGSRAALVQMEGGGFLEGIQQSLEQTGFANLSGKGARRGLCIYDWRRRRRPDRTLRPLLGRPRVESGLVQQGAPDLPLKLGRGFAL